MKVKVTAEVRNGAIHGSTMTAVIEIDDEDLEDLDGAARELAISAHVEDHVLAAMVGWNWEAVDPFTQCSRCASIAPESSLADGLCGPCQADDARDAARAEGKRKR